MAGIAGSSSMRAIALLLALAGFAAGQETYDDLVWSAEKALEAGRLEEALELAERALALDPEGSRANRLAGMAGALIAGRRLRKALDAVEEADREAFRQALQGVEALRSVGRRGGTLRLAYVSDPPVMNPILATDTVSDEFRSGVVEYLAARRVQDPSTWEPRLAESWRVSDDGLEITVRLRADARWHRVEVPDGATFESVPCTADDVLFTWTVVRNPGVRADHLRPYLDLLERVEKVDDRTVRWRWREPYFRALDTVLFLLEIVPRHFYTRDRDGRPLPGSHDVASAVFAREFDEHWSNADFLCGTGPLRQQRYDRRAGIQVVVADRTYPGRQPYFDRIQRDRIPDENARIERVLRGELDAAAVRASAYERIRRDAAVASGRVGVAEYDYPVYRFIGWNLRRPIFRDRRVRRALTLAIDRQALCTDVFGGLAEVHDGPFFGKGPFSSPRVESVPHDPDRARRFLADSGWTDADGDGVVEAAIGGTSTPLRFRLLIYADSADFEAIGRRVEADLAAVGVDVELERVPWGNFLQRLDEWDFDAAMLGWGLDYLPDPTQLWHSRYAEARGSSNFIGFENEAADDLIERIRRTIDVEERLPLYHAFHDLLHEEQPYTWLFADRSIAIYSGRLGGVRYYGTGLRPCRDYFEWYERKR